MRLGNKFILLVAVILAITLGANALYAVHRQRQLAMEQLNDIGRGQGEFLALIAPDAILGYDFVRLNQYVEQATRQPDILFAAVFDTDGRPLTSFVDRKDPTLQRACRGEPDPDVSRLVALLEQATDVIVQRYPVSQAEHALGSVVVAVDRIRIERALQQNKLRQLFIYGVIIVILSGAIYLVFRLNVLRPVAALIRGAKRVGCGEFDKRVERYYDDELGTLTHAFNAMMTEIRHEQDLLNYQANYDLLTGLPNRNLATDRILHEIEVSRREGTGFALMFVDLDNFKYINDIHGHVIGDRLLVEVSHEFRRQVRAVDLLARLGGDEYLVLLPGCNSPTMAQTIAERLTGIADRTVHIDGLAIHARCSVGIAFFPQDGTSGAELMAAADSAMYAAKRNPAASVSFYTTELNEQAKRRVELEHHIHVALERNEFSIAYQPIIRGGDRHCVGAEALLRWEHPEFGPIPPMQFIPVAESTGQIVPLGGWVLEQACTDLARLDHEGLDLAGMSINVSRVQLRHGFDTTVVDALRRHGLATSRLTLELTESILMEEHSDAERILAIWRDAGIKLSLDDFGTGFSSLSYLKRFDFDLLKIDKSFVDGLPHNRESASLIKAILAIGDSLGMEVIAEGVEGEAQCAFLERHGGGMFQGYLFGKPMPFDRFKAYLHEHNGERKRQESGGG